MQGFQSFGGGNQANELDVLGTALFDLANGVNGAAAGSQHGIQNKNIALGNILGQLAIIFHRLQGLLIAVQANVADLCSGDQGQHAVHHAQTGAQDGNQGQLAASQHMGASQSNRSFHFNFLGGQVAGGLIAQQGGNFADQITELFGAGVAVTHQADFVLDQGMVYNFNNAHGRFSLQYENSSDTMQSLVPGGVQQWGEP